MTCDNASNNDAMIQELEILTPEFAGFASHTQCFLHIVNLVAKSLLRQFDAKKATVKRDCQVRVFSGSKSGRFPDQRDEDGRAEVGLGWE